MPWTQYPFLPLYSYSLYRSCCPLLEPLTRALKEKEKEKKKEKGKGKVLHKL